MGETSGIVAVDGLLGWWALAGVSTAVTETAVDWLKPVARPADSVAATPVDSPLRAPDFPETLSAFRSWLETHPSLPESGWPQIGAMTQRILPSGPTASDLMVISDLPDSDDMAAGRLFSGQAGELFDAMIDAVGLTRDQIHLASLAMARPSGGQLNEADSAVLAARMRHHIGLVAPRWVLLLGDRTSRALIATSDAPVPRGLRPLNHSKGNVNAIATFHPRLLLLQSAAKADCWRQLQHLIESSPL